MRSKGKQLLITVTFVTMVTSMVVLIYGLITLPFWWKMAYFQSTSMAMTFGILNAVMLGSVLLLEKLDQHKD